MFLDSDDEGDFSNVIQRRKYALFTKFLPNGNIMLIDYIRMSINLTFT